MGKKKAGDWYLGFIQWLIGGFVLPVLMFSIVFIPSLFFIQFDSEGKIIDPVVDFATRIIFGASCLVVAWLGARIYARKLKREYELTNTTKVVKIATGFFIVIGLLLALPEPFLGSSYLDILWSLILLIGQSAIFYSTTKKEFLG